jgi:alpha-tubulin suppressor-like RCC1 family protein
MRILTSVDPCRALVSARLRRLSAMKILTLVMVSLTPCAVSGQLWRWGSNYSGQLGTGVTAYHLTAGSIVSLLATPSSMQDIVAASGFSLVLMNDGTVKAWGRNDFGQLGDGTTTIRFDARGVTGLTFIKAIAARGNHALALRSDGTVWTWGYNSNGQVGDNSTVLRTTPAQVLTGVKAIAAGSHHSLALKSDGSIWAWGNNEDGELGDGTMQQRLVPTRVAVTGAFVAIAAGDNHSLAIKSDGTVWAWGSNYFSQLGNFKHQSDYGYYISEPRPVKVWDIDKATQIGAGDNFSIALRNDGTVWAWGRKIGELQNGGVTLIYTATKLGGLNAVKIAAGRDHCLALTSSGQVVAWGQNASGQLGDGTTTRHTSPVAVIGIPGTTALSAGNKYSLVLSGDQSDVLAWGSNKDGQNGRGPPVLADPEVNPQIGALWINARGFRTVAVLPSNSVSQWGSTRTAASSVVDLATPTNVQGLPKIVQVVAGTGHTVALTETGGVWAWGDNSFGAVGDGSNTFRASPVALTGLPKISTIATGARHTVVLDNSGNVWTWGDNTFGQLGDGTAISARHTPLEIPLHGVVAVSAGDSHTLAIREDGTAWAWGRNSHGQLGDGTTNDQATPVQVIGVDHVLALSAGGRHSLALRDDGTVWAWGDNNLGQLGNFNLGATYTWYPTLIPNLAGIISIAAGETHNVALGVGGTVWTWGSNQLGELGTGTISVMSPPKQVFKDVSKGTPPEALVGVSAVTAGQGHTQTLVESAPSLAHSRCDWWAKTSAVVCRGSVDLQYDPRRVKCLMSHTQCGPFNPEPGLCSVVNCPPCLRALTCPEKPITLTIEIPREGLVIRILANNKYVANAEYRRIVSTPAKTSFGYVIRFTPSRGTNYYLRMLPQTETDAHAFYPRSISTGRNIEDASRPWSR